MLTVTISRLTVIFGAVVSLGLVSALGLQRNALGELKVGGPVYSRIELEKDLVADILPPPLYVVEAYGLASEAFIHKDVTQRDLTRIDGLKKAFDGRRQFWNSANLSPALAPLVQKDLETADAFWAALTTSYFPAAKANDTTAMRATLDVLEERFHTHQQAVDELVATANAAMNETEAFAAKQDSFYSKMAMTGGVGSVLLFLVGLWYIRRRAVTPLGAFAAYMGNLAGGDYSQQVPYTERNDEIGGMARAVEVFRQAALERLRMRQEMEEARTFFRTRAS
ncbi:HAMP domain-containing protein [Rhizobium sp. G21]|uniref:HAMP domain-containing protein n=1 Tax=Rhizobium sp. G21 TaxID=2758439 RepID=UPI0016022081|nr:HAMP domain-containing protein [Rhizobium sp. G21]MBB1251716.1 HAMP domain-containing protein [Rhizobium sp. G21]